ncbi:MAG: peptide-methionine (S)-S-oxide reductase MsrA [Pseudolabrys sp.]|nr:peptide-methionine (S)-S-oxide reductase MsrA [Pseudolabrys sp.]MDP2295153.1 peptide-methionine (S)-S-oxide reductase MsrA [Pseudolabrys sp.]
MRRLLLGLALIFAVAAPVAAQEKANEKAVAIFAGGCFWCTESDFDKVPGVLATVSGYIAGKASTATYKQVSAGGTGHAEAVEVTYDPAKVSYQQLLEVYWRSIDPTVKDAQFCDHGDMYRSAIFVRNDAERKLAEASKKQVEAELKKPVYTQIADATPFYAAEEYHQDFYKKNPAKYKFYRWNCGRDQRLEQIWGPKKGEG